jgi:hypothetical protein
MSLLFDFLARTVSEAKPHAHSSLHETVVGVRGYPRLDRKERSSTATWPLVNTPACSDSDTAAVTTGIVVEWA